MLTALTRPTGPELEACELTHIDRQPIDVPRAVAQHDAYLEVLRSVGVRVVELPRLPQHPDAVFVEDIALVLPELALLLRPGVPSRLGEIPTMAEALAPYRTCVTMPPPATLDGGDIIVFGAQVIVGETTRSNEAGASWLRTTLDSFGYEVVSVPVAGVLHLKSAATVVDAETVIVNRPVVDLGFLGARLLEVPEHEPQGANVVRVGTKLLVDASASATIGMLTDYGADVVPVSVDEFSKAEGAISCKGVIFQA